MEKTCPEHNLTLELVKEGISKKSGKKYNAFWSCPNRDCKHTENIPEQQGHFLSMQADFRRSKEIAYFNSVNAAVTLLGILGEHGLKEDIVKGRTQEAQAIIADWRDWFRKEWEEWYIANIVNEE